MANKNIFDASLEITKASIQGGVIKALEINGAEIPLAQDLEDNKEVTIDVSAYTDPVVINPTSGKDGMKKATVTLSSIPGGSGTLYCWKGTYNDDSVYIYTTSTTPEVGDMVVLGRAESGQPSELDSSQEVTAVSESGITMSYAAYSEVVFERYSTGDIALN